jgi:hypothetical protein
MQKVKSKYTKKIFYFRFFSENVEGEFWYTETIDSVGFNLGELNAFEPIGKTWDEVREENES